jgi:hypothetical protein
VLILIEAEWLIANGLEDPLTALSHLDIVSHWSHTDCLYITCYISVSDITVIIAARTGRTIRSDVFCTRLTNSKVTSTLKKTI